MIKTEQPSEELGQALHVETVDLSQRDVVLPSDRVGMVIAQPHLLLTATEPYKCRPEAKERQLAVLADTLEVARSVPHRAPKTHFTIFPEFSIPGMEGIAYIETILRDAAWPHGTIVIGGTDALSRDEFAALAGAKDTHLDRSHDGLARIAHTDWINCAVTWVKAGDGSVERWLQPKLHPAWLEQNIQYQDMFRGNRVFMFKGPLDNAAQYHFCSLVCFDWIATVHNKKAWFWVMEDLHRQASQAQAELPLSWFFVIQCNPKPSHDAFLNEVLAFFDQTTLPTARRDRACLVFANSAGKAKPGRTDSYGNTSLVFSPHALFKDPLCRPTFTKGGLRFRSSTLLTDHRDVLFRERGACIHSFLQINPNSLHTGVAGRATALENAHVFPLNGMIDPRTPAGPVAACVKWLNDELDDLRSLSAQYGTVPLAEQVNTTHRETVLALRGMSQMSPQSVTHAVELATNDSTAKHADDYGLTEAEAVEHLVHTLDIISLGFPQPKVGADPAHATVAINNQMVDLLAIRGNTHEACIEHSKRFLPLPRRQFLLISRDRDNTRWRRRFGSFLQPDNPTLGEERNFTDPSGGSLHLGYYELLDIFRKSATAAAVREAINAELAA